MRPSLQPYHAHTAFLLFSLHTLHLLYFTLTTCGVSCDAQVFDPAMATKEQPKAFLDIRAFTDHHSRCAQPHPRVESRAGHVHVSLAKDFKLIEKEDIPKYTEEVMTFWRENHTKIPTWARAARFVFSLSPHHPIRSHANCERVFSIPANFYGEQGESALADQLSAALMFVFNSRSVS